MEDRPRFPHSFSPLIPLAVHAVFQYQPYGSVYAAVSEWLVGQQCPVVVPLIVSPPTRNDSSSPTRMEMRHNFPNMTEHTLVICR